MPFADVSEIIGKRDLVGEAQQWAQLGLQKKKLALMEEKAQENSKVNNYEFNQAEFGVDNPYFSDQMRQLNDKSYQWVLANAHLLKIDPTSPDATEEVKNAHRINANLQMSAKQITAVTTNLKNKHKTNRDKMNNTQTGHLYNTVGNHDIVSGIENLHKTFGADGGMFFDIDFRTGNLVISERQKVQVQETNENGELIFINSNGEKVTQDDDAYDENSKPSMIDGEEWDEENVKTSSINDWSNSVLQDVSPKDPDKLVSYKDTFRIVRSSESEENPSGVLNEVEMKDLIHQKIIGGSGTGVYDPTTSQYILTQDGYRILNDWRLSNPGQDDPSLKDLINFAYQRAEAEFDTSQAQRYKKTTTKEESPYGPNYTQDDFNQLYSSDQLIEGDYNSHSVSPIADEQKFVSNVNLNRVSFTTLDKNGKFSEWKNKEGGGYANDLSVKFTTERIAVMMQATNANGETVYLTKKQELDYLKTGEAPEGYNIPKSPYTTVAIGSFDATGDKNLHGTLESEGLIELGDDATRAIVPLSSAVSRSQLTKNEQTWIFPVYKDIAIKKNQSLGGGSAADFN